VNSKIYYIENRTKEVKSISTVSFSVSSTPESLYWNADDISISSGQNFLILKNETNSTINYILKIPSGAYAGYLVSEHIGDKSSCWTANDQLFTMITSTNDPSGLIVSNI
jgi:hypothetical protein